MLDFLKYRNTLKNRDRDFIEWHKGRRYYSLWAVEVDALPWGANLENSRKYLAPYLLPGCARRPHITVCTCGFVEESPASGEMLKDQTRRIRAGHIRKFPIHLGGLKSFTSGPYLEIEDPTGAIARVREILAETVSEDRTGPYVPHMTVGFYNGSYPTREVADRIGDFDMMKTPPVEVTQLGYFIYRTDSIFSPLEKQFQIALEEG